MTDLHLVLGNKNYSSWSMRPWVLLRQLGIPFTEETIWIRDAADAERKARLPAGRVPVLRDGALEVWDSLAIVEYVAERFADREVWPTDPGPRATARSVCAEMHAGFSDLRNELPMNCRATKPARELSPGTRADTDRIVRIWQELRAAAPDTGPFLFGRFGAADAFFAPVVSRFATYSVPLDGTAADYAAAVRAAPAVTEWLRLAADETRSIEVYDRA